MVNGGKNLFSYIGLSCQLPERETSNFYNFDFISLGQSLRRSAPVDPTDLLDVLTGGGGEGTGRE